MTQQHTYKSHQLGEGRDTICGKTIRPDMLDAAKSDGVIVDDAPTCGHCIKVAAKAERSTFRGYFEPRTKDGEHQR